jgi:hypothetical protein
VLADLWTPAAKFISSRSRCSVLRRTNVCSLQSAVSSLQSYSVTARPSSGLSLRSINRICPSSVRSDIYARFEVFTAVTMKDAVFWDVTPCGSCKNRRCGGS